jgi:hypothetical protein
MEPEDIEICASLVLTHPEERRRYGALSANLPSAWAKLLPTGSLNTTILESSNAGAFETAAVGVSAFIDEKLLRELKTVPRAWIGPTLTQRVRDMSGSILDAGQIREGNSNSGLNLAIWTGVVSPFSIDPMMDLELFRGFFDRHLGYQIKEIICQPPSVEQICATFRAGLFWLSEAGEYIDGRLQPAGTILEEPFLIGGDREAATRTFGSWFSGLLLAHNQVRLYLRPAEQRLLLAALRGLTDEELAAELGIPLSAVKKTWREIYLRTGNHWNGCVPEGKAEDGNGKRGREKKQHLLSYLRAHMEELRPVLPPIGAPVTSGLIRESRLR